MVSILRPVKIKLSNPIIWSCFLISAAFVFFARAASAQTVEQKPKAIIEETSHDFGDVFVGEDLSHAFKVRNAGDAPLTLSDKKSLISSRLAPARFAAWTAESEKPQIRAASMRAAPS